MVYSLEDTFVCNMAFNEVTSSCCSKHECLPFLSLDSELFITTQWNCQWKAFEKPFDFVYLSFLVNSCKNRGEGTNLPPRID